MKYIKGQIKDFWHYFKLYYRVRQTSSGKFRNEVYAFIALIFAIFIFYVQVNIGLNSFAINFFTAILCGSAFGMGMVARTKPSTLSVAPFSPKQRVVFAYLTAILNAIIYSLIFIAIMTVCMLLMALIAFLASGENVFVVSEEGVLDASKWSEMFYSLFELYLFFSIYAISHIERQRHRNIAITVWFVVSEALMLVLVNAIFRATYPGTMHFVMFTAFATYIDNLANPWVPSLVVGILAAIAFIASVFISYRRHRSLNF